MIADAEQVWMTGSETHRHSGLQRERFPELEQRRKERGRRLVCVIYWELNFF